MKKTFLFLIFFFTALSLFAQNALPQKFIDILNRAHMEYTQPDSFTSTPVIQNTKLFYDYAVKHVRKDVEIRYVVHPLDEQLKTFHESEKNKMPGSVSINPNSSYIAYFYTILFNISGGQPQRFNLIDGLHAQNTFNAGWAAYTFTKLNKEFAQDYKYCLIVAIHKNDFGDAYYVCLANEKESLTYSAMHDLTTLKFKE